MKLELFKAVFVISIVMGIQGCASLKDALISEYKYPLYGGEWVGGKEICGAKRCKAGSDGNAFAFTKKPWSPPVGGQTTPKSAVMELLGHVTNNSTGGTPFYCDVEGKKSPFGQNDVTTIARENGEEFKYVRSEILDIDVTAAVESDLASLQAANVLPPSFNLAELKVKLESAYSSLDSSKVVIEGRYIEYALTPKAYRNLFQTKIHNECLNVLKSPKNYRVITGVGIVWFDLKYDSASASQLISDLKTEFLAKGIEFDIGVRIKKTVNESLSSVSKNGFQVITWTLADKTHEWEI